MKARKSDSQPRKKRERPSGGKSGHGGGGQGKGGEGEREKLQPKWQSDGRFSKFAQPKAAAS